MAWTGCEFEILLSRDSWIPWLQNSDLVLDLSLFLCSSGGSRGRWGVNSCFKRLEWRLILLYQGRIIHQLGLQLQVREVHESTREKRDSLLTTRSSQLTQTIASDKSHNQFVLTFFFPFGGGGGGDGAIGFYYVALRLTSDLLGSLPKLMLFTSALVRRTGW